MTIDSINHSLVTYSGDKQLLRQEQTDLTLEGSLALQRHVQRTPRHLVPVSLPYTDLQGRVLQLWKYGVKLIASMVNSSGELQVISGKKIRNALGPEDTDDVLLARIEKINVRMWQLAYLEESGDLYVWPHLVGAMKDSPMEKLRSKLQNTRDHLSVDPDVNPRSTRRYTHAQAAGAEKRGEVVGRGEDGKPSDHVQEVDNYRRCCWGVSVLCGNRIRELKPELRDKEKVKFKDPEPDGKILDRNEAKQRMDEYRAIRKEASELLKRLSAPSYPFGLAQVRAIHPKGLVKKPFKETVQQNRLTGSYNATHPGRPILRAGGGGGSIGGVASEVGIIEGLFDSLEDLEEDCHYFYLPSPTGKPPFSDQELELLVRELAIGIYIHDAVPFFSLHFNADSDMYPVVHPAYQNTLVGRVISLLDYYMKGFLNGGFFDETFVKEWQTTKTHDKEILKSRCIDLREYCKRYLPPSTHYYSVKELIQKAEIEFLDKDVISKALRGTSAATDHEKAFEEPAIFSDYSGFRSSFRIIAKQNSFNKAGRLFELDAGFDVFYTIEPDEAYKAELEKFRSQYGRDPSGYRRLVRAYEQMKHQIETMMPLLPVFSELFEQLKIISFFSYYFKTLKNAQKVPVLDRIPKNPDFYCSPLFPHLPIRKIKYGRIDIEFLKVIERLPPAQQAIIYTYVKNASAEQEFPQEIWNIINLPLRQYLQTKMTFPLSDDEEEIANRKQYIAAFLQSAHDQAADFYRARREELPEIEDHISKSEQAVALLTSRKSRLNEVLIDAREKLYRARHSDRYGMDAVNQCEAFIKKHEELLVETDKDLKEIGSGLESLKILRQDILDGARDQVKFYFKRFTPPYTETASIIEQSSELSQGERDENQRIVGGCGLGLGSQPVSFSPEAKSLLERISEDLVSFPSERFRPVQASKGGRAEGHVFTLRLADEPTGIDREYAWMSFLLSEKDQEFSRQQAELFNAIAENNLEAFTSLISADLLGLKDGSGASVVHRAAAAQSVGFLQKLAELKADFTAKDAQGWTALHFAAKVGSLENSTFLIARCPKLLEEKALNNATPLYVAAQHDRLPIVSLLMQKGANPNVTTTYGMTPLYCAIHHKFESIALELLKSRSIWVEVAIEDGTTPLFLSLEMDMPTIYTALLQKGADVNRPRKDGLTPFLVAAKSASADTLEYLVENCRCDLKARLKSGKTCLHLAAERMTAAHVLILLAYQADIFLSGWDLETPLMTAIRARNYKAVTLLVDNCSHFHHDKLQSYLDQKNIVGDTAVSISLKCRHQPALFILFEFGATLLLPGDLVLQMCRACINHTVIDACLQERSYPPEEIEKAYIEAWAQGEFLTVRRFQYLFGKKDFKDSQGWTGAHFAAKFDMDILFKEFLATKPTDLIQTTKDGLSIAAIAAQNGSCKVLTMLIDLLLDNNVPLEAQYHGRHLILAAIKAGECKTADVLFHHIPRVDVAAMPLDEDRRGAAHHAAILGDVEMLNLLVRRGADFEARDAFGKTPIQYVLEYEWEAALDYLLNPANEIPLPKDALLHITKNTPTTVVKKLLRMHADLNAQEEKTLETPIFKAIKQKNFPVLAMLSEAGASLEHRCARGYTPFLRAAELGNVHCMSFLFSKGAQDVTPDGRTALHICASLGHEECVFFLLNQGVDCTLKSASGATAEDLARENGFSNICAILKGEGATLQSLKRDVVDALESGRTIAFFKLIASLPLNATMTFDVKGQKVSLPLLHLIYQFAPSELVRSVLVHQFLRLPGVNSSIVNSRGQSLVHLMALHGEHIDFEKVDPLTRDSNGMTVLHYCALCRDPDSERQLERALKACKKIDVEDDTGATPLFMAVATKHDRHAEFLLKNGANPNRFNHKRSSPLSVAIREDDPVLIRLLLDYGADIHQLCGDTRMNSLHIAISEGFVGTAKLLIDRGADVNRAMVGGIRPVHIAARKGEISLLNFLRRAGAELKALDDSGWGVSHYAILSDEPKMIDYLVSRKLPLNAKTREITPSVRAPKSSESETTPFHIAARKGNVDVLNALYSVGGNPEALVRGDVSPFVLSTLSQTEKSLKFFRKMYIFDDPVQHRLAIKFAIMHDAVAQLEMLNTSPDSLTAPVDAWGQTTAALAAASGSKRALCYLEAQGVDLKLTDRYGKSAFELALTENKIATARYLLMETDAVDLDSRTSQRTPYLHEACRRGFVDMAALLLEAGAPIDDADDFRSTPLHIALQRKDASLISLLLSAGATIDLQAMELLPKGLPSIQHMVETYARARPYMEAHGETVIHTAIRLGIESHFSLLTRIADIETPNAEGVTALQLAQSESKPQFVRMLREAGASFSGERV